MIPDLLTAKEARKILRLGKNAIYELARQRKLEYVKIGTKILFPKESIERFIKQNTVPAARNYFSMNRFGFRQYPGCRSGEPDHEELAESINQNSPHSSPPVRKIDHNLTKDNASSGALVAKSWRSGGDSSNWEVLNE